MVQRSRHFVQMPNVTQVKILSDGKNLWHGMFGGQTPMSELNEYSRDENASLDVQAHKKRQYKINLFEESGRGSRLGQDEKNSFEMIWTCREKAFKRSPRKCN